MRQVVGECPKVDGLVIAVSGLVPLPDRHVMATILYLLAVVWDADWTSMPTEPACTRITYLCKNHNAR
ncbi:hypothetical protein DPMN_068390 [Dreissena polymorpha]|uniref:Uncharacterized protein n=1 Tax=Dreissena polymorpha TaxID=45954 RepID=A0A9D4BU89_DREPO|nr:hypothetical protein DPMN_068390 [Dreissena polymorpha]